MSNKGDIDQPPPDRYGQAGVFLIPFVGFFGSPSVALQHVGADIGDILIGDADNGFQVVFYRRGKFAVARAVFLHDMRVSFAERDQVAGIVFHHAARVKGVSVAVHIDLGAPAPPAEKGRDLKILYQILIGNAEQSAKKKGESARSVRARRTMERDGIILAIRKHQHRRFQPLYGFRTVSPVAAPLDVGK